MKIKFSVFLLLFTIICTQIGKAQDTTIIQTLTFDSTARDYVFQFPVDTGQSYERIIMQYRMRCKNGLVSTTSDRNKGCGEWDYSCNTYITDSAHVDSVMATGPSHTISGFSGSSFYYTTIPTYNYTQYTQKQVTHLSTISETSGTVGSGIASLSHPFDAAKQYSKVQYLWTASELLSAGVVAGDISSLRLTVTNASGNSDYLRIAMKHTTQDSLSSNNPETNGFTEVYFLNATIANGINEFLFYNNFTWNGSSNLLVEFSFTNSAPGINNMISGHDAGIKAGLVSSATDYSLDFNGGGSVDLDATAFSTIDDEVTISLWCYGNPDILPANTSIFEGFDGSGRRQVNSHLPWSNSQVYWDAGSDGNYDRINQAASDSLYEGKWNHWAFTKNASTGVMKIFVNGAQWVTGSGKTKQIDLRSLIIGSSPTGTNPYYGKVDEFRVWDTELSGAEIASWMYKEVNASHPKYANLVAYYNMNGGAGNTINDISPNAAVGIINGVVAHSVLRGREIYKGFTETTMRPNLTFVQGTYNQTISDIIIRDSVQNSASQVTSYHIVSNSLTPLDTNYYYPSGNIYVYDDITGNIIDTIVIAPVDTVNITTLSYHAKSPSKFEIMSFVTPYGININFGLSGVMWEFDVSDFKPILHGKKRMQMTRGGEFQEEMDIRFLFIEGTPPREVMDIQQIWRVDARNYTQILNNDFFEPRNVTLDSNAAMYKIRSAITGHGQEGEFIPRTHFINIDGGPVEFSWLVWKECADNEIFPQGGTWVYDRAGWCPGKATDVKEYPLTGVLPGQNIEIEYSLTSGSGDSRYIVNNQLVSYGAPNFVLDARVVDIKKPSNKVEYKRDNPICQQPVIIIQNTGSTNLNSLTLTYNVIGGTPETYNWLGSLGFLETDEVVLPIPSQAFWITSATTDEFEVTISAPNGGTDAYANNNHMAVPFTKPKVYTKPLLLQFRTNLAPFENSYSIKDEAGNIIKVRSGFTSNTIYYDTLNLPDGCYYLEWLDSGQDGIAWWANNDGTGYVWMRELGGATNVFQPDYGAFIKHNFVLNTTVGIEEKDNSYQVNVFPNPADGLFNLTLNGYEKGDIQIDVYDLMGSLLFTKEIRANNSYAETQIDLSAHSTGIYFVRLKINDSFSYERLIKQ